MSGKSVLKAVNRTCYRGDLTTNLVEYLRIALTVNKKGKTVCEGAGSKEGCNNTMEYVQSH